MTSVHGYVSNKFSSGKVGKTFDENLCARVYQTSYLSLVVPLGWCAVGMRLSYQPLLEGHGTLIMARQDYLGLFIILISCGVAEEIRTREKRYLLTPPSTQWGVFVTIAIPLPEPTETTSVAWFFEANFYTIDNATWWHPLFGETIIDSRSQKDDTAHISNIVTRNMMYISIENMLQRHGLPGRECLLRAICEAARAHVHHNGVVGDLLYIILTPSSSAPEDAVSDEYYEAQYQGSRGQCGVFEKECPENPLDYISAHYDVVD